MPSRRAARADVIQRSDHVGRVWLWAHDPANADNPITESIRALLRECQRLADIGPEYERLRVEVLTLQAHNAAWQKRFAEQVDAEGEGQ